MFGPTFIRHMHDDGTTRSQIAAVKVAHSKHASNNPKALYKERVTVDEVLSSRMICYPLSLLDCCVETDNAAAIIITSAARARGLRQPPVAIELGGTRPNNTSGGQLCEGYTHGVSLVIENVRQSRGDVDDYCPIGPDGRRVHTYDYREGGCSQVRGCGTHCQPGLGHTSGS
ncbi:hypothetical protein GCM10023165_47690 [Variovorax defluvii]|uniref:Thiolase N-terminal domain-containing protein n=1 Tax=Variovorax defluvii TaxID=913761 RepID=A0ABP8IBG8_9BURK